MLVVVGRAAGKEGDLSGTGEHLDKRHVLLAPPQPVLGVAHEELREEHATRGGHVRREEEGDLRRVRARVGVRAVGLG